MGCHTWTYKKISALSESEKQDIVDKKIKDLSSWWGFNVSTDKVVERVRYWFENDKQGLWTNETKTPEQYALSMLQEYKSKLKAYQGKGFDAVVEYVEEYHSEIYVDRETKEKYWNIGFDDPFRMFGYPDVNFKNKDELLEYLKNTDNMIGYYDEKKEYNFVEGYTEGLVKRIDEYFEKHGEDNLYLTFG